MSYGYHGDIPTFSRRAPTMKSESSSSSRIPSALSIPSGASSNASSTDSYMQTTFRDFASHANRCERCCDPLGSFLDGREMCPRGRHLAKMVTTSLFDEANEMYKESHRRSRSRKNDGWQHLEVDIPKGCEAVRSLFMAIDRGLQLPASAASSPMSPSSSSKAPSSNAGSNASYDRPVLGETWDYVPAHRSHSDEDRKARRRDRDEEKHRRSHSAGGHHGHGSSHRRHHSDETVGVEERERRPYVHSSRLAPNSGSPRCSHDDISVDSGYSTANGCPSPDISRGSQFARDMERRKRNKERTSSNGSAMQTVPRSALKKSPSVEHLHPDYHKGHSRAPSSPRLGKGAGVGFNIEGHYYVPGYP